MHTQLVADDWLLTPERLAIHVPTQTAVVADLHLGYHEARQTAGDAIPTLPLAGQLQPLRSAQRHSSFTRLVVAGDLFERHCDADLAQAFNRFLNDLGITWTGLVPGNHDRRMSGTSLPCPIHEDGFLLGAWRVIHGDRKLPEGNVVMGHWHPCARQRRQLVPCFLVGKDQLILPAFSRNAAGVDVRTDPRWKGHNCYAIDRDRIRELI